MSRNNSFTPGAVNSTFACTTTSGTTPIALTGTGSTVLVQNVTSVEGFVAVGSSTVSVVAGGATSKASDGGFSVPGNTMRALSIPLDATHIVGITAASVTTFRISRGEGGQ